MKNKLGTPPVLGGFGEDVWVFLRPEHSTPMAVFDYNSEYYVLLEASWRSPVKKHLKWYRELKLTDGRILLVRFPKEVLKIDPDDFAKLKEKELMIPYGKLTNESTDGLYGIIEPILKAGYLII